VGRAAVAAAAAAATAVDSSISATRPHSVFIVVIPTCFFTLFILWHTLFLHFVVAFVIFHLLGCVSGAFLVFQPVINNSTECYVLVVKSRL
jgi:hypothetical protein